MEQEVVQLNLNVVWIITCAAMVMLMQAGFTALESGLTRAKNTINVAMKNITDFTLSILFFWLLGYGLMFGESDNGFFGTNMFMLSDAASAEDYASFVFQATFAGTAATIVSGAIAERMKFSAYAIVSVVLTAIIYPISGHWIWSADGWLAQQSMVDFAGSTVVHSLGGWVGLAGAIVLGPRLGRFNKSGKPNNIQGHSLVLAVLGVLVLWFGWFGFNGGSTLTGDQSIALIIANTMLAAAAGGISCFIVCLVTTNTVQIEKLLNGVIGGLVSITAGCAVVETGGAVMIGLLGGVIVYYSEEVVLRFFKIDDPVNVISAHGVAGAWGTLALAIFAPVENLPLKDAWAQFGVQLTGVIAIFAWGFILGLILFSTLKMMNLLRVSPDAEEIGLNIHEHGATSGLADTMRAMNMIVNAYDHQDSNVADLTSRVTVEVGTEAGDIANLFNQMMDNFENTIKEIKSGSAEIDKASLTISHSSGEMKEDASIQANNTRVISQSISEIALTIQEVAKRTIETAHQTQIAVQQASTGRDKVMDTVTEVDNIANDIEEASQVITALHEDSNNIGSILETINGISEQTNLLALNAAIEAARAGEAGRGFAVVADEVRTLSSKTRDATEEIREMMDRLQSQAAAASDVIEKSHCQVKSTVQSVSESHQTLETIHDTVLQIEGMTATIASATEEQTAMTVTIKENMEGIELATEHSHDRAKSVAEISETLANLSSKLKQMVSSLQVDNDSLATS